MANYRNRFAKVLSIVKALADPTRLRLLLALQGREVCVCQLIELVRLAPSTVSKHMAQLRAAGLVSARKHGRWVYYAWPSEGFEIEAQHAVQWLVNELSIDNTIMSDRHRLKEILREKPEELCRRQSQR